MNPRFVFWWRWLLISTFGVLLFGLSLVLFPGATQRLFNLLYFPSSSGNPQFSSTAVAYIKFVCSVLGAVMIGWSLALVLILFGPFRRGLREGWNMVTISLVSWFLPDTVVSLISGFWQNALLNLAIAFIFAVPLAATYRTFRTACA